MNDEVPLDSVIVKDLRLTKHPFHRLQVQSRSTRRVAVNVVIKYSRIWPSFWQGQPGLARCLSVCGMSVTSRCLSAVPSAQQFKCFLIIRRPVTGGWDTSSMTYFDLDRHVLLPAECWPVFSCTPFRVSTISRKTSGLVWVEFNAPPDTIEVISEAVFTANHLTDSDKQNSTGKYIWHLSNSHWPITLWCCVTQADASVLHLGEDTWQTHRMRGCNLSIGKTRNAFLHKKWGELQSLQQTITELHQQHMHEACDSSDGNVHKKLNKIKFPWHRRRTAVNKMTPTISANSAVYCLRFLPQNRILRLNNSTVYTCLWRKTE